MTPYDQFLAGLDNAVKIVTEKLYALSQEMGDDFKKIGWFAPYEDDEMGEEHLNTIVEEEEELVAA